MIIETTKSSSALSPAAKVHGFPQRVISLFRLLLSATPRRRETEIHIQNSGDRPETLAGEPPLRRSHHSCVPLHALIRVALHHRHARRHPNPSQVTHVLDPILIRQSRSIQWLFFDQSVFNSL
ncbi:hypothetical protein Syun_027213 [Stephania yunnanensis]|uniref:Uncharacterized protein n=1 Tax=Stephania yunnanensis TaxID=152371 RepID=A0AAP0EIK2_9MAGN